MDTQEMFDLGAQDAERGEPQAFYYQHYYHYRRGYDQARRKLGPAGLVAPGSPWLRIAAGVAGIAGIAGIAYLLLGPPRQVPAADSMTATPSVQLASPLPTRTAIFPTATPVPPTATPAPLVLRIGGSARVSNTEGRVLRGRSEPGLLASARVAFREGEDLRVLDGPVEADGYVWWQVEGASGTGWSAEQSPDGVVWLVPITE